MIAEFSNGASGTIAQLENYLTPGNDLSIAIKNHTTGKSGVEESIE